MRIECAGWKKTSCDDGPGVRSVLFFQGCSMHCPGCQNSSTHKKGLGKTMEINEVIALIEKECRNKKVTISGGEPLEQLEALCEIVDILNERKYNICIYTGWSFNRVPDFLKEKINYLKCGHFDLSKKNSSLMYVGSENQEMYVKDQNGKFVKMQLLCQECA